MPFLAYEKRGVTIILELPPCDPTIGSKRKIMGENKTNK
jgi:hypothetical protein